MKISELQELLIETILNTTKDELKKDETIAEHIGIEDIDFDSNDNCSSQWTMGQTLK